MVEILLFVLLFLGIGMIEKNFKKLLKQNEQIIQLLNDFKSKD